MSSAPPSATGGSAPSGRSETTSTSPPASTSGSVRARISSARASCRSGRRSRADSRRATSPSATWSSIRSEEHTSELQSRLHLVCRLLLEKKKKGPLDEHIGLPQCAVPHLHTDVV